MFWKDGLPDLFWGGHLELCTANELVERLQIHYEMTHFIFLGDKKGSVKHPLFPEPSPIVPSDSIVSMSEDIAASWAFGAFTSYLCIGFTSGGF